MKIAAGAAKGLEHLHDKANPPVIYRDFKSMKNSKQKAEMKDNRDMNLEYLLNLIN
jgi:hypothetical protein